MVGAVVGFIGIRILANLERWEFYTIRSLASGETVMSRITQHPIDRWIPLAVTILGILAGTGIGICIGARAKKKRP
jgi:hypothetical protein